MPQLSNLMTVVALSNGMIGGTILVLPLLAIRTGYLLIPIVSIVCCFVSFFTCSLILKHTTSYNNVEQAILNHFHNKKVYLVIYNILIMVSMVVILILYFYLLNQQFYGIFGVKQSNNPIKQIMFKIIPYFIACVLLTLTCLMRKHQLGSDLLGYGIVSVIGYCIFMTWNLLTAPQFVPNTQTSALIRNIPLADHNFIKMAAALTGGYAIHNMMIPVIKENPNKEQHNKILMIVYGIGFMVYTYIGYGCYGIINRKPVNEYPETIVDYFRGTDGNVSWQMLVIEVLYSIHLLSAFPEFLIITKTRFFSIFRNQNTLQLVDQEQGEKHMVDQGNIYQYIFFFIFILGCLMIKLLGLQLALIIQFNGSVICFLYVYMGPILVHLKCVYWTDNQNIIQICPCKQQYQNKSILFKILEGLLMILLILVGIFVMVYTLYTVLIDKR